MGSRVEEAIQEAMEAAIELEALTQAEPERGAAITRVREVGAAEGSSRDDSQVLQDLKNELAALRREMSAGRQPRRNAATDVKCFHFGEVGNCFSDYKAPSRFRNNDEEN